MAPPKNVRADGTYMIVADNNDNPKLGAKILSDGRESLFLDYYLGYQINDDGKLKLRRRRETLKLYLWQAPRDPSERAHNKSVLELAKKIRFERSQNLIAQSQGYRLKKDEVDDILAWMDDYAEKYTKADVRIIKGAIQHFKSYLSEVPGLSAESALNPASLTPELVRGYAEWLKAHFNGEGPASTLARFRKILRQAYKDEIFHRVRVKASAFMLTLAPCARIFSAPMKSRALSPRTITGKIQKSAEPSYSVYIPACVSLMSGPSLGALSTLQTE